MRKGKETYAPAGFEVRLTSGEMIRELRLRKNWTQQNLADRVGMAVTNLSQLENDKTEIGKARALMLAKALGVHPATLMFPGYETFQKAS